MVLVMFFVHYIYHLFVFFAFLTLCCVTELHCIILTNGCLQFSDIGLSYLTVFA